ncbi:MAG: flavodoxin family protein [Paludibacteraceae bacterium]
MNLLIINGSPKKNGLIAQMLDILREDATQAGARITEIYANDLHVKPCMGCMVCRTKNNCVLPEDDAQRVLQLLTQADAIVIGAPCFWGNIPGQLKLLFDRIVYGMMRDTPRFPEPLMKGKKAVFISTCTTPFPFNILMNQSHGAIRALREIGHYSGWNIVAAIERGGVQTHPQLTKRDIRKCHKAFHKLCDTTI